MSTSEGSPLESGREIFHSMCADPCGPDCTTGPLRVPGVARFVRSDAAEATFRAEIEPYGERSRSLRFPWGIVAFLLLGLVLSVWSIWFSGHGLGWW